MASVGGRVAVVTGAANGLGREIAVLLGREGAKVALGDLDAKGLDRTAREITAAGGTVVTSAGDLTEEAPARIQGRQWGRRNQCAVDRCHGGGKVEA